MLLLLLFCFFHSSWSTPHNFQVPTLYKGLGLWRGGGGGEGGRVGRGRPNFPLSVSFQPSSHPFLFSPISLHFFNGKYCAVLCHFSYFFCECFALSRGCHFLPIYSCLLYTFCLLSPRIEPHCLISECSWGIFFVHTTIILFTTCWQTLWFVGRLQQREDLQTSSNDSSQSDLYERLVCMYDLQCRKLSFKRHQLLLMSHYYPSVEEPF